MVHNPQPWTASFLVLALPLFVVASGLLLRRATKDLQLASLLTPGAAIAAWLLGVHVASLVARSFSIGLWVGTLVGAAGGAGVIWAARRRGESLWVWRASPLPRAAWIWGALATLLLVPAALGWCFHDEKYFTGHMAIASQIENGHYPPRHGVFAAHLLRYHYGFNLLCALVGTLFRLRVDRAIDLVTIAGWFYSWCLLWGIGTRLAGARAGLPTALLALLGGGIPFFVPLPGDAFLVERLLGLNGAFGAEVNPTMASYFFQHPWALGVPLALCALALGLEWDPPSPITRGGLLLVLFLALALSQIVLFLTLLGGLLGTTILLQRQRPRQVLAAVLLAALTVHLARSFGGFFAPQPTQAGSEIVWQPFSQTGSAGRNLAWNLVSLGIVLPLAIAGFFFLKREARLLCLATAGGSLLVANLLRYAHSWDIYKFATVATLILAIPAAAAVLRLEALKPRALGRIVAGAAVVLAAVPGIGFLTPFALRMSDIPRFLWTCPPTVATHARAIDWLRHHARAGDVVLAHVTVAPAYAQWGGLPQAHPEATTDDFGFPRVFLETRLRLLQEEPEAIEAYLHEGVRWVVLAGEDPHLEQLVRTWEQAGRARAAASFEGVRIVALQ